MTTYADPNASITGIESFSAYMGEFQNSIPGGHFKVINVCEHHSQVLAQWELLAQNEKILQRGTSYARLDSDGKFCLFAGFFESNEH